MKPKFPPLSPIPDLAAQPRSGLPSFDFLPPTRVVFGVGSLNRLGELTRELGGNRVLVVTDPGLETAGHPQRAVASLNQAGLETFVFDQVEENPTTRHVNLGTIFAQKNDIDFLVAVGGGSAMDCAKGINFLLTNGGTMADYRGYGKATEPMLPSITIPTTAGTGSESQSFALIADDETHMKMACGDRKVAFTGIDALSHAVESFVTTKRNLLSQSFAHAAWRLLESNMEIVLRDPSHLEARGAMQLGANFAGTAIENSMLGACHACANPLTAHYGLTHGLAIGIMLPHVIRFNAEVVADLYAELAGEAGLLDGDRSVAAEALAKRIISLMRTAGLPTTLSACGINPGIFPILAEEAAEQWTGRFNPRPVTQADLLRLYEAAV
jgi:alcohol dehydrogenase class IV